jgi:hypothetical protein
VLVGYCDSEEDYFFDSCQCWALVDLWFWYSKKPLDKLTNINYNRHMSKPIPSIQCGISRELYDYVSIEDVSTPKEGYIVRLNRWWIVRDGHVLFYKQYWPQCNPSKEMVEYWIRTRPEFDGCEAIQIHITYIHPKAYE